MTLFVNNNIKLLTINPQHKVGKKQLQILLEGKLNNDIYIQSCKSN